MATVVLIFSGDISHHTLEARGMTLLAILVNQISMDHFMNQGPLNLGEVIVQVPKQLYRQVNLIGLKDYRPSFP
jgi:hypothetical protein